jgi:pyruvate/2-oxoacid:ferredoxin oxidoreductase beta subunit
MKKDFSSGVIDVARAARRLGSMATKTAICPGCGRVQVIEALTFELGVIERAIKEVCSEKADGVKWCEACR